MKSFITDTLLEKKNIFVTYITRVFHNKISVIRYASLKKKDIPKSLYVQFSEIIIIKLSLLQLYILTTS